MKVAGKLGIPKIKSPMSSVMKSKGKGLTNINIGGIKRPEIKASQPKMGKNSLGQMMNKPMSMPKKGKLGGSSIGSGY